MWCHLTGLIFTRLVKCRKKGFFSKCSLSVLRIDPWRATCLYAPLTDYTTISARKGARLNLYTFVAPKACHHKQTILNACFQKHTFSHTSIHVKKKDTTKKIPLQILGPLFPFAFPSICYGVYHFALNKPHPKKPEGSRCCYFASSCPFPSRGSPHISTNPRSLTSFPNTALQHKAKLNRLSPAKIRYGSEGTHPPVRWCFFLARGCQELYTVTAASLQTVSQQCTVPACVLLRERSAGDRYRFDGVHSKHAAYILRTAISSGT